MANRLSDRYDFDLAPSPCKHSSYKGANRRASDLAGKHLFKKRQHPLPAVFRGARIEF